MVVVEEDRGVLTFIVGWHAKGSRQKNPKNVDIFEVLHPLILGKAVQKLFLTDPLELYQSYISHKYAICDILFNKNLRLL